MIVSIAAFAAVVSMSGCLISGSSRSYSSGARVSEHLLVGFEPGQTAYDEIEQTLGVPTRTINRPDGSTVLVYEFTEVDDRESGLLFVFHSETYRKTTKTTYIEVIDGIFERAWVETCS
jgi:hypothetical protein